MRELDVVTRLCPTPGAPASNPKGDGARKDCPQAAATRAVSLRALCALACTRVAVDINVVSESASNAKARSDAD